jgi:cyclopropane fatty-acyl-phospholipid synthase-like methyltransferase
VSQSVDRAFAWSVFTHLWEEDIRHYLKELYRVMKPGAKAYLTCYRLSPEIIASAQATNLTRFNLTFAHEVYPGCHISDPDMPLGAIGFSTELLTRMVEDSGLWLCRPFVNGAWSGHHHVAEDGQDAMVLIRP